VNTYAICYDLNRPGQNYAGLIDAIKALANGWFHNLDSTWIVNTALSAVDIRDKLRPHLDTSDELLVMACGAPAAWTGFSSSASQWLKQNLK
jgi:hypothetical protein